MEEKILSSEVKNGFQWYAVRTLTNQELKIKRYIEQYCENGEWKDFIQKVFVPVKTVVEVKNGKKTTRTRKFFPGYVFLCMKLYDEAGTFLPEVALLIRRIQGVTGFMENHHQPIPMRPAEVDALLGEAKAVQGKKTLKVEYKMGEMVKVMDGPFMSSSGIIDEIDPEKGRLRVSVSIFGRSTPVELEYWQVQREG